MPASLCVEEIMLGLIPGGMRGQMKPGDARQ